MKLACGRRRKTNGGAHGDSALRKREALAVRRPGVKR
jgi:hypothetical protein